MGRYTIAFCTIASAFFLPWWATLLLCVYGSFRFPWFFEALLAGLIIDSMYATHLLFGVPGAATLSALAVVVSMMFFRRHIRHESFSS